MNHLDSILESIQCSSPRLSGDCSIDTSCDDSGSNNNSNNDNGSNTVGASSLSSVNNIDTTGNSSAVQSKLSEQQQEWGHRPTASSFSLATTAVVANTSPSMNNSTMDEATAAKMYQQAMNDDGDNDVSFPMEAVYEEGSSPARSSRGYNNDVALPMDSLSPSRSNNSNNSPYRQQQQQRARTATEESNANLSTTSSTSSTATGGISKHTLVKLMREQITLVRNLTNAQIASKKELEVVKMEKERLEREAREREEGEEHPQQQYNSNNIKGVGVGGMKMGGIQEEMGQEQSQLRQQYEASKSGGNTPYNNNNNNNNPRHSKLNLPTTIQRGSSDNRSISSRSFYNRFLPTRNNNFNNSNGPQQSPSYPRRHPDARYYTAHRNRAFSGDTYGEETFGENTLNNGGVSVASTIMPAAIIVGGGVGGMDGMNNNKHSRGPNYTGPQAQSNYHNRDKIEITPIPERNVVPPPKSNTCFGTFWWIFSHMCTLFIPDVLLCCIGRNIKVKKKMSKEQKKQLYEMKREAKQAWREKVAIFVVMLFCSACFIGISGVVPMFLCRETTVFVSVGVFLVALSCGLLITHSHLTSSFQSSYSF